MSSTKTCQICNKSDFKYNCPKCNILYCSVVCYKDPSHQQCSETFYRDCVQQEMALQAACKSIADIPGLSDDIKRMYAILKRMESRESCHSSISDFDITDESDVESGDEDCRIEELDSDDEEDGCDLANRIEGVDINDPDALWQRLNSNEQQEFKALVQSGEIAKLLPPYQPWWEGKIKKNLIEDISEESTTKTDVKDLIYPEIISDIPAFEKLSNKPPSPCLPNNLYNILAAYTATMRYFNGEHSLNPHEAANHLILLSATLRKNANFESKEEAAKSIILDGQMEGLDISSNMDKIAIDDVEKIIEGRFVGKRESTFILAALSDIHRLLTQAKKPLNKTVSVRKSADVGSSKKVTEIDISRSGELTRTKLNQIIKKIEFFMSFVDSTS